MTPSPSAVLPTNASSSIGALAASLQAIELEKLLAGEAELALLGREVLLDAGSHRHFVTVFPRNARCRFDHEVWSITGAGDPTLARALSLAGNDRAGAALSVEGRSFARGLVCPECDRREAAFRLLPRGSAGYGRCPRCHAALIATGFDSLDWVTAADVSTETLAAPLRELGLGAGDVFAVRSARGETRHFRIDARPASRHHRPVTVAIVGCGNIGSHLVPHVARLRSVERLILIDPDRYERGNLPGQAMRTRDVGRPKTRVQADLACAVRSDLEVEALVERIEDVPLGILQGALLAGCLDSRAARQALNETAWRIGSTWVDAAVEAGGRLVRVIAYAPGETSACLECAWGPSDYAMLEQRMPCDARSEHDAQ